MTFIPQLSLVLGGARSLIKLLKASVPSTSTGSLCARMDDVHMESNLTQNPSGASVFEKMFKKIKVDFNVF